MKALNPEQRQALLERLDPDAALLEPREHFDRALVAVTDQPEDHWPRTQRKVVAVYNRALCIEAIQAWLECDVEDAVEWLGFNTEGAWVGEGTPTFQGEGFECDEE